MSLAVCNNANSEGYTDSKRHARFPIKAQCMPSEVIRTMYERRASMPAFGESANKSSSYSTPLNIHCTSKLIIAKHIPPEQKQSEEYRKFRNTQINPSFSRHNRTRQKIEHEFCELKSCTNTLSSYIPGDAVMGVRRRIRSREDNNRGIYEHKLHRTQRRVLEEWMSDILRHRVDVTEVGNTVETTLQGNCSHTMVIVI